MHLTAHTPQSLHSSLSIVTQLMIFTSTRDQLASAQSSLSHYWVSKSAEVLRRRRRGDEVLVEVLQILHVRVHRVQAVGENEGIASLEGR